MVTLLPFLSSYFCYLFMNSVSVVSMSHSRDKTKHLTYFSIRCFSQSRNPTPYKAHLCFNIYLKNKKTFLFNEKPNENISVQNTLLSSVFVPFNYRCTFRLFMHITENEKAAEWWHGKNKNLQLLILWC